MDFNKNIICWVNSGNNNKDINDKGGKYPDRNLREHDSDEGNWARFEIFSDVKRAQLSVVIKFSN